jgi:hypothetical protein
MERLVNYMPWLLHAPPHHHHYHHRLCHHHKHHQKQPSVPTDREDGWTPELIWMLWRKANILARN